MPRGVRYPYQKILSVISISNLLVTTEISCRKSLYLEKIFNSAHEYSLNLIQYTFSYDYGGLWVMQIAITGQILVSPVFKIELSSWAMLQQWHLRSIST